MFPMTVPRITIIINFAKLGLCEVNYNLIKLDENFDNLSVIEKKLDFVIFLH